MPQCCLIAALARNRVIGRDNRLPWHLPDDLRHFKALTLGHPVLMGRKTYESIGRPLPGRVNIVVTRQPGWQAAGVQVAHSLAEALAQAADATQVFVIGGATLYVEALPLADVLYLTEIEQDVNGDSSFPDWPRTDFIETARETRQGEDFIYHFVTYHRLPLNPASSHS